MSDKNNVPPFADLTMPKASWWTWPCGLLGLAAVAVASPLLAASPTLHLGAAALAAICFALLWIGLLRPLRQARQHWLAAATAAPAAPLPAATKTIHRVTSSAGDADLAALKVELERLRSAERELLSAKQAAEAAVMAKGEFLATMSHEIRTPLNGIIPLLDLVMSTPLANDQRDYISTAYSSARQLLSIVDDILDFSKLDASKLELESVGLNLKEIVDGVARLMGKNAEHKGLKFSAVIDPNVRVAGRGDPTRLRQVLTNLVSNAIKFTERGSIMIQVSKRSETRTHTELLFAVKDTGMGIPLEAQGRLFKEFSQADNSTTRTFGGTGLGLSICKRIVDLMGGQIGVKSEPGRGSIFWFTLPLAKALGDVVPGRSSIDGARAMIVSGDQAMQKRLSDLFGKWSAQAVLNNIATDVVVKLKASSSGSFAYDFLLLDFGSMRATALAILRNVLREPGLDALRILCLSGDDQLPEEVRMAPHSAIISRSFVDAELRTAMQGLLEPVLSREPGQPLVNEAPSAALAPAAASAAPRATAATSHQGTGVGGHVLLVEDNPVNRQVAQRLLALIGVSFETAENGKEGVDLAAAKAFDAVLMDCQMPIMDGYTATRHMRKLQEEGSIGKLAIIAMTANAMVGDREKCLAAGMDDYMSKPLNRALIEQILRKWLPPGATSQLSAAAASSTSHRVVAPAVAPQPITPGSRNEGAAIDLRVANDLIDLMGSDFADLVRVYLEDTPKNMAVLERAAHSNDIDALIAPAHSMKSTSANLGALLLSDMSKRIEQGARSGGLSDPVLLVAQLQNEFLRVSAQLRQMIVGQ